MRSSTHLLLILPLAALLLPRPAAAQTRQWTRQFGTDRDEEAYAVATGPNAVYVVGETIGALPLQTNVGGRDGFVRKLDVLGNEVWTRQFGTSVLDSPRGVAADSTGVYVVGSTDGTLGQSSAGSTDAFVRKYDVEGREQWTRQFGASNVDEALAIASDGTSIYVVGYLELGALPGQTSAGGADAFVRKYDANGNEVWTRQFGTGDSEQAYGVAVDTSGVYVAGRTGGALGGQPPQGTDVFVRKYDSSGNVVWTRQFGGPGADYGNAVAVDATGVYVAGETTGLPGQTKIGGLFDAFAAKLDLAGAPQWMRQFGTDFEDAAFGVTVNAAGVSVVGFVENFLPGFTNLGATDFFIRRYDANGAETGTLQFGTRSTDKAYGVASDSLAVYVCGYSATDAQGSDAVVAKFPNPPNVSVGGVVNNGSFALDPAPVAPGSIAAVFGTNLNDSSAVSASSFGPNGRLVTTLGGSSATVNNFPAPMFYSFSSQIGVQIPFEVAGQTTATIRVTVGGQTSVPRTFNISPLAPGIFTTTSDGKGTAAVLHQDGTTPVTAQNPAKPNEVVVFFVTGLGALSPPLATGEPSTFNRTADATVTVDTAPAEVLFSGAAPFFVGLNQVNVRIPPSTRTAANIPVALTVGGRQSNAVTIPVAP